MGVTYFKRYRMEIALGAPLFHCPELPSHYRFVSWDGKLVDAHAEAKFHSFEAEIDANVFPCLGEPDGCRRLMGEISRRDGFLPTATWLATYQEPDWQDSEYCGTVQGVRDHSNVGGIQNLGITPPHRGIGLGTALLHRSLLGFREMGVDRVFLEVTAQNVAAIRLYERLGFRRLRTVYKAAELAYS